MRQQQNGIAVLRREFSSQVASKEPPISKNPFVRNFDRLNENYVSGSIDRVTSLCSERKKVDQMAGRGDEG